MVPVQLVPAHKNALKTRSQDDAYQLRHMHLDFPVRARMSQMPPYEDEQVSVCPVDTALGHQLWIYWLLWGEVWFLSMVWLQPTDA